MRLILTLSLRHVGKIIQTLPQSCTLVLNRWTKLICLSHSKLSREVDVICLEFFEHRISISPCIIEGIHPVELFNLLIYKWILCVLFTVADAHTCKSVVFRWHVPIESFRTYALSTSLKHDTINFTWVFCGIIVPGDSMYLIRIWCHWSNIIFTICYSALWYLRLMALEVAFYSDWR